MTNKSYGERSVMIKLYADRIYFKLHCKHSPCSGNPLQACITPTQLQYIAKSTRFKILQTYMFFEISALCFNATGIFPTRTSSQRIAFSLKEENYRRNTIVYSTFA